MKKFLLFFFAVVFALSAWAQERVVTGKVSSAEDGTALPGVNVVVKGTTKGTVTDADGRYSVNVPATGGTLLFSFIGLQSKEIEVGDKTMIDTQLGTDVTQLSEIVVVGYGTQERRDLTGSIVSVKGADLANLATPSFDQQLAGRAAGVQVSLPSGVIGQAPVIRIRGTNSINSGTDPLFVIDGMPVTTGNTSGVVSNNALADINPNDIESFEVLKDGAASAIYGSRAANGVILITTKKGKKGKAQVSYDAYVGFSDTFRRYKVLDAADFIAINNEKFAGDGDPAQAFPMTQNGKTVDTDWQKRIFRTGFVQNHAVSLRGATDKTNYFFSLGYTDQNGVLVSNSQKRVTARFNIDHHMTNWLSFGTETGLTRTENVGLNTGSGALSGNVFNALNAFPNVPEKNADGTYNIVKQALGQGNNLIQNSFALPNLGYVLAHNIFTGTNYRVIGNAHADAVIHKDFTVRTQIGIDGLFTDDYLYNDAKQGDGYPSGVGFQQHSPTLKWDWMNTLTYNKQINEDHKINVVAGLEYTKTTISSFSATGVGLSSATLGQKNIITGTYTTQNIGGDYYQQGFQSVFGRANYSFKDKYLLQGSFRRDQISSFTKANYTGLFPAGSVGWRLSGEDFWKSVSALNTFSDFKLRASYAQTGNTNVGPYPYAALYSGVLYGSQSGLEYSAPGNANLKWETSKKFDYGFDMTLLDSRLTVTADYFLNKIDHLILQSPTAPSLGVPQNFINKNVGAMQNQGFEISINYEAIKRSNFTWTTSVNYSTNHNKVTALDASGDIVNTYNITRVGQSVGSFYGFVYDGVNRANGNPIYTKGDGTLIQGNIDDNSYYGYDPANPKTLGAASTLDPSKDRKILGTSTPTYFGGWNNSFTYKNFDLGILSRFSGGNKVLNLTRQGLLSQNFVNNGTEILGRWQSESNPGNGQVPRLQYGNDNFINLVNSTSTRFLEKGDFFRIQNVTLGYNLPKSLVDRMKIARLRVYAQVQNVLLITKYKGIDPESSSTPPSNANPGFNRTAGLDNGVNPQQRTFTFGVNVGF